MNQPGIAVTPFHWFWPFIADIEASKHTLPPVTIQPSRKAK